MPEYLTNLSSFGEFVILLHGKIFAKEYVAEKLLEIDKLFFWFATLGTQTKCIITHTPYQLTYSLEINRLLILI